MTEHYIPVQRTARYYTIGSLNDQTRHVWFCLHGFGQLARYFSRKFTDLDDGHTLIIIPEGLSRMYLDTTYQRLGASWMSREDRAHEISDYVQYLDSLYDLVMDGRQPTEANWQITVFGFSQGAATACRWLNNRHVRASRLVLWAGYFPQGLADLINPSALAQTESHYVYGRQDQYINSLADVDAYLNRLNYDLPSLKITAFDGSHTVEPTVLHHLVSTSKPGL